MPHEEPGTASSDRRLRRALVRAAVADNLARPGEARPGRPGSTTGATPAPRRWPVAVLILAGLIASVGLWSARSGDQAPPETLAAASSAPRAGSTTSAPATTFDAPVGIARSVFPLAVRKVVVDAGHGGIDTGAASPSLTEKDLTLDIAERLVALLEAGGFEPILTRRADEPLSLRERVVLANEARADLFVSIHVNWFSRRDVRGVETYYLGATEDPELQALAQRENHESGYSLADLRHLLDGVYADLRQDESRQLAARVQRSLYRSLLPISPELRDRGVKTAPFVVLVATEMPAILAEVSCLSNRQEAERLARPRYRDHIARALYDGIAAYARDVNQTVEKGS